MLLLTETKMQTAFFERLSGFDAKRMVFKRLLIGPREPLFPIGPGCIINLGEKIFRHFECMPRR